MLFPHRHMQNSSILKLIDSLSQLLHTSLPGSMAREVGLFPIVALQDMGVANVARLEVVWEPITSHLSQVGWYECGACYCDDHFQMQCLL
jgi:hypothetical protein